MRQSLLIAVRFPEGRYHGREDGFNGADGWPPSPGRLFQALVAAAARGANLFPEDMRALKWLERARSAEDCGSRGPNAVDLSSCSCRTTIWIRSAATRRE